METIIVQETDEDMLYILTIALKEEGFRVYPIQHCDDHFLNMIESTRLHVVMLDFKLKGDEVLRVLRLIKAKYRTCP